MVLMIEAGIDLDDINAKWPPACDDHKVKQRKMIE
jgi:hypothetical protein